MLTKPEPETNKSKPQYYKRKLPETCILQSSIFVVMTG